MSTQPQPLKVHEWIETPGFSYMFFWPYEEPLNPRETEVDVRVKPKTESYQCKTYIGTFITEKQLPRTIESLFEELSFGEDCANGTYVPLNCLRDRILVREISEQAVTRTIDDLLKNSSFEEFFTEEGE